jgi:putative ATP-dependent endonuclease of the OLD family
LIGSNGSGKTAVLQSLSRLFGTSQNERKLRRSDFHVLPNSNKSDIEQLSLSIEAKLEFPELSDGDDIHSASNSVPEFFQHLVVKEGDATPFCRLRLDGTWMRGNIPEGEIEESLYWIKSAGDVVEEEDKQVVKSYERGRIHVLYAPAARDTSNQLKYVSGTLLARLLNAIHWSDEVRSAIEGASQQVSDIFKEEAGLKLFHNKIDSNWMKLHDTGVFAEPRLRPLSNRLEEILKQVEMIFTPNEWGTEQDISQLSDGLRSLFYFALLSSIFDIEREAVRSYTAEQHDDSGDGGDPATEGANIVDIYPIELDRLRPPTLTIFAIEEPENHLAPYYLARITNLLSRISIDPAAQVLLTSHSASVLRRVDPAQVRHFRLDNLSKMAIINSITLPSATDAAYKYIKEAVQAYPELYFARLVVLGEGDSEEIVIPRIAECLDLSLDPSMISVVPLGGRHVNHFWRLLTDLRIPYVTLLDLDRERAGAGWGRIKYVSKQLLDIGVERNEVIIDRRIRGELHDLSIADFDAMGDWDVSDSSIGAYTEWLETHNVFFCAPLDLDMLMLESFKAHYQNLAPPHGGPRISVSDATEVVLGKSGAGGRTYSVDQKELFPWYAYLFLNKSKPSTHLLALTEISDAELRVALPDVLRRLVTSMRMKIQTGRLPEEEAVRDAYTNSSQ